MARTRQEITATDDPPPRVTLPPTTGRTRPSPLGVPDDYQPPRGNEREQMAAGYGPTDAYVRSALYREGDEYAPLNTPEVVPSLQLQLINAGQLDPESVRFGMWDDKSITAYKNVLEIANRYGSTVETALRSLAANPTIAQINALKKSAGGGGRQVQLANPQDIQAVANEVAPSVIGRRLTQVELDGLVKQFHSSQGAGTPPSLDVSAEAFAREADPTAATARDMVGVFDVALNMMRGGSGGVQS